MTENQLTAAVAAVLAAAKQHGRVSEMYITEPIATEVAKAVIDAYEANAPEPPKAV